MKLPKTQKIKLINKKEFIKLAKKVAKDFEDQNKYLYEKKLKEAYDLFYETYSIS